MKKTFLLCILWLVSFHSYPQASYLGVMTFNIRYDNPADGDYSWANRRKMVFRVIQDNKPDIIGFQEVLLQQLKELGKELHGFQYSGVGRDDGKEQGEFAPVFYNSSRFSILDGSTFWLSETPEIPGSKSWNTACTRIVTWVKLSERKTGKILVVFNTHFDHISEEARVESAKLLQKQIRKIAEDNEVIVTGDFNSNESGEAYKLLTSRSSPYLLSDTRKLAGEKATGPSFSFIGFPFNPGKEGIIDFIFISGKSKFKVSNNQVIDYHEGDKYPSDHLPVISGFVY